MKLSKLKDLIAKKESERDKLVGRKEMFVEELQEMGYETVKDAEKALKILQNDLDKLRKKYNIKLDKFKEKYMELIND